MNRNFTNELQFLAEANPMEDTLRAMGYRAVTAKNTERYFAALQPPYFGLHQSMFDMKYSSEEFLRKLCSVLGVGESSLNNVVAAVKADLEAKRVAFKPYLWVDTQFVRTSEPVFVLAAMEGHRHLMLRDDLWRYPLAIQLEEAQEAVCSHWHDTFGELPVWGTIDAYLFFYAEERAYVLAPTGEVVGRYDGGRPSQAKMSIGVDKLIN